VTKKTKKQIEREIESAKLFIDLLNYVGRTRRLAPKERVNVAKDLGQVTPYLQKIRNLLEFPPKSPQDMTNFSLYSLHMIQFFSTGALRDWIVRGFLESLERADGKVRENIYSKIRHHLFPYSKKGRFPPDKYVKDYERLYSQLKKNHPKRLRNPESHIGTLKKKHPKLKLEMLIKQSSHYRDMILDCIKHKRISDLAHILLSLEYCISPSTSRTYLTKARKHLKSL